MSKNQPFFHLLFSNKKKKKVEIFGKKKGVAQVPAHKGFSRAQSSSAQDRAHFPRVFFPASKTRIFLFWFFFSRFFFIDFFADGFFFVFGVF